MIGFLKGRIISKRASFVVVDVSGVGYKIHAGSDTLAKLKKGETTELHTHLVVRENVLDLYGFSNRGDLEFFEMIIGISGIGPKSGLAILDLTSVKTLKKAIGSGDTSYLTKVSGIGKKTAEKIVLELHDKLSAFEEKGEGVLKKETEVLEALKSLGYTTREAREALRQVNKDIKSTSDRIKKALKILSGA